MFEQAVRNIDDVSFHNEAMVSGHHTERWPLVYDA